MGTNIDYSTVSHETIYHCITEGPGSAAMADASRGWQGVAAKLQELQALVDQAVRGIGAAQQGAAADAATHATMALTPWIGDGVTAANGMAARVSEQADFFAHTRDNMPAPRAIPEVSFSQDPGTWMADHAVEWLPGIQTEHERTLVAAQQDEQRARELMSAYQGTSNENLVVRQNFAAAPMVVAEVVAPTPSSVGIGGTHGGGGAHLSSAYPSPAHPASAHSGHIAGGSGATAAPAVTAPQLASGVPHAPAVAPTSAQLAGGYPSPGEAPMAGSGSVRPTVAAPFGPSTILAGSGGVGEDRIRSGSRFSTGGGVGRGGGFGPRPIASSGAADSHLGRSPVHGSGPMQGSTVSGSAEPGSAGRGGAGWADAPLGATGGSGRTGGAEHRRPSYLMEEDTNAIVGALPRVAPPVIGADESYR